MSRLPSPAPAPSVEVRAATRADLPRVAEIFARYALETQVTFEEQPWDEGDWAAKLDDLTGRGLPFLVAAATGSAATEHGGVRGNAEGDDPDHGGGRVVGFAYAGPWRTKPAYRHTVEDTIYLDPAATGRGVGTALLAALLAACTAAGVRQVVSVVADVPEAAGSVPLHRRFGFEPVGRLTAVGFKHGRWVDTLLLQRSL